ncbi:outer membrane protein assembly factor [Aggregatimonas sangjinii]|uniref:Outer membrane protein assembly factor n=1 Tax=Aggregatimonas sangjinii TaxID=2583587 RepID=A0A5B7SMP4_9FLAO|nr:POTRA domain-containing protein [Aggregatimonas sangjinii]QCW98688.1 outer membrane protein assembly factor [Aggregatimonas sangjinii]
MRALFLFFLCLFPAHLALAQEGMVADVKIQGNKKTKSDFIRKLLVQQTKAPLDSVLMDKDINRLKRLPSISHAYYQVFTAENGQYNVYYTIEENFTLIPFANLYTSTNDDFAFRVGLQEFNLLGRNINVGGFYQFDIFNSYGVLFRAPYLFSRKLGLGFNYKDLTTQEPVFFDDSVGEDALYRYNNTGYELSGLYEFNFKNRIELGFSLFTEDYQYQSGATSPDVPQALNVKKHLFKLIYNHDNLKYDYQYLEGFRSTLNFQYVGSTDEQLPEFVIGFNDFAYFHRIGERGNWASRLRLGLASNVDSPFAPFTVDNNLNIRGVGNTIDRGTGAIVFNTEYRHTLVDRNWFVMQGNVFLDGGSWRNPGGPLSDFGQNQNIRIFPGLGVRFMHKRIFNAIFRIDYGYGLTNGDGRGFVFGIGQYF